MRNLQKNTKTQEQIQEFNNVVVKTINQNSKIKAYWNFFPTPKHLIEKMLEEYKTKPLPKNILEPSAGKGDIVDYINQIQSKRKEQSNIYAFEFVPELQNILKQKQNCKILGNDFLSFHCKNSFYKDKTADSKNTDKNIEFDLIVMNPPFDKGVNHVLHAWDLLAKGGKLIALLNQYTYYNAYTPHRLKLKTLIEQYGTLNNLGACFNENSQVERKARVGVVMITLNKKADVYYKDIGINLSKYSNEMIRVSKARYIVKEFKC